MSQISKRNAYFCELQINTKTNEPEVLNEGGAGLAIPAAQAEREECLAKNQIAWEDVPHGTRICIELEAKYVRGRGSVDEYIEQTAIANPHTTVHYKGPEDDQYRHVERSTDQLPPEAKEIKPHPFGVELGRLATMLKDTKEPTLAEFLTRSFSKVSPIKAQDICEKSGLPGKMKPEKVAREQIDKLFKTIQETKLPNPSTECLSPIGEDLLLKGMHAVVPGEFYTSATRPPAVYRGNPFQIEVGLVYGGTAVTQQISKELLLELLDETDARTLRQFLMLTFYGLGADGADRILQKAKIGTRKAPKGLSEREVNLLFEAMHNVNLSEGQTMNVMRYANRVPLQFQESGCAITQTIKGMNWRSYGLSQSRNALPSGPVSIMVHLASVWVPFTSESKEAIALYPEIQKELRLALQAVGRKLGMYLRRRLKVKQEADRRQQFLRYLGEIAAAVGNISGVDKDALHEKLIELAKSKTAMADVELDENGKPIAEAQEEIVMDLGENVLIVEQDAQQFINRSNGSSSQQRLELEPELDVAEESEESEESNDSNGSDFELQELV